MIEQLLQALQAQGIELWTEDGRLRFRAPQGAMTADLKVRLKRHKDEIIAYLMRQTETTIPVVAEQADYELSSAQWRLWVLMQMEDSSVAYNVPLHQLIDGPLDVAALQQAVRGLVARHESLRTCFTVIEGMPRQVVRPVAEIEIDLDLIDVSHDADGEKKAWEMSLAEAQRPFDLAEAPLLHVKLVKIAETRHALLLTLHHIICDGVSIGVLNQEIAQLYAGIRLAPLPIQYKDYAHWQNNWLASAEAEPQRQYWLTQLGGELPVLHLPSDFPRPAVQTFNGREHQISFQRRR